MHENNYMKILIINPIQFGHADGYFYYCKYLAELGHEIVYVCLDKNLPRVELLHVRVEYIKISESRINWRIPFLKYMRGIQYSDYDIIFFNHQRFAFLFRLFGAPARSIIDIRTGDLSSGRLTRYFWNTLLRADLLFFRHVTILSGCLSEVLALDPGKCIILPLGADSISDLPKNYEYPHFLYVGTFYKRNISQTVRGLELFAMKYPGVTFKYDIIGYGNEAEVQQVKESIAKSFLKDRITFHGRKNYTELKPFFDRSNIGFSYIPRTPFFDCQPPTKTYEYVLSGLLCIATCTSENKKLISTDNGILCDDNPQSLCNAIEEYYLRRGSYNCDKIKGSLQQYYWKNIVKADVEPFFLSSAVKQKLQNVES
jgi:hypothetical protein